MRYVVGEKLYLVGSCYVAGRGQEYSIETKEVLRVGNKYATLGLHGVNPDSNCNYRIDLAEAPEQAYSTKHHGFNKDIAFSVFRTREAAEKYIYDQSGSMYYTFADPIGYPLKLN